MCVVLILESHLGENVPNETTKKSILIEMRIWKGISKVAPWIEKAHWPRQSALRGCYPLSHKEVVPTFCAISWLLHRKSRHMHRLGFVFHTCRLHYWDVAAEVVLPRNVTLAILSPFPRRWATVFRWTIRDIISPRGSGGVFLLHTGKTSTGLVQSVFDVLLAEPALASAHQYRFPLRQHEE